MERKHPVVIFTKDYANKKVNDKMKCDSVQAHRLVVLLEVAKYVEMGELAEKPASSPQVNLNKHNNKNKRKR